MKHKMYWRYDSFNKIYYKVDVVTTRVVEQRTKRKGVKLVNDLCKGVK